MAAVVAKLHRESNPPTQPRRPDAADLLRLSRCRLRGSIRISRANPGVVDWKGTSGSLGRTFAGRAFSVNSTSGPGSGWRVILPTARSYTGDRRCGQMALAVWCLRFGARGRCKWAGPFGQVQPEQLPTNTSGPGFGNADPVWDDSGGRLGTPTNLDVVRET